MKVWMILTVLGQTLATAGPLPYGLAECETRAAEVGADHDETFASAVGQSLDLGVEVKRQDVDVGCVERNSRPPLQEFPPPE